MSYTRWAYTEPSESGREKQACVYIINGLMYDTICSYPDHYFICEENCPTKSRDINVDDAKDLVNLGGRDYYFSLFTVSSDNIIITYVRTKQEKKMSDHCLFSCTFN
jgi:hypothetical protein